jgi:hypothetical protein
MSGRFIVLSDEAVDGDSPAPGGLLGTDPERRPPLLLLVVRGPVLIEIPRQPLHLRFRTVFAAELHSFRQRVLVRLERSFDVILPGDDVPNCGVHVYYFREDQAVRPVVEQVLLKFDALTGAVPANRKQECGEPGVDQRIGNFQKRKKPRAWLALGALC